MPIKSCTKDGKSGYKWGDSGTCYTGKDGRKKALKQGQAIELSKQRRGEKSEFNKGFLEEFSDNEILDILSYGEFSVIEQAQILLEVRQNRG